MFNHMTSSVSLKTILENLSQIFQDNVPKGQEVLRGLCHIGNLHHGHPGRYGGFDAIA